MLNKRGYTKSHTNMYLMIKEFNYPMFFKNMQTNELFLYLYI